MFLSEISRRTFTEEQHGRSLFHEHAVACAAGRPHAPEDAGRIRGPGRRSSARASCCRRAIEADRLTSSIFWGPPGCGKTTLASIIAETTRAAFVKLNAVTSGVADVREVLREAENRLKLYGQPTYLLLDECHRWSKSQSDSILPTIEQGTIRFIGSTTENPMIAMTPAIVSRCRLFHFERLTEDDVRRAVLRAAADPERGCGAQDVRLDEDALNHIAQVANGDCAQRAERAGAGSADHADGG